MVDDLIFLSSPRISLATFTQTLRDAGSPAAPQAAACYAALVGFGVDPAIGLAFFQHESTFGRMGIASRTKNWGNLRKGGRATGAIQGFAAYSSWVASAADWAQLIAQVYVRQHGLDTVRKALPLYAPSSDGNVPTAYADAVVRSVLRWQAESDPWAAWGDAYPLPAEQRDFAIPAMWRRVGDLGAAASDEISLDGGAARLFQYGVIVWRQGDDRATVYR